MWKWLSGQSCIYAGTIISAEIPTGILADKIGRKPMIQMAAFFSCLEFAILISATEFWQFGLAVFLAAIGTAWSSGALYAYLNETLMGEKRQNQFEACWLPASNQYCDDNRCRLFRQLDRRTLRTDRKLLDFANSFK